MVVHALALSGTGLNGNGEERWRQIEYSRERERREISNRKMESLLARMSVLMASREGRPPTPLKALVDIVGEPQAKDLVTEASRLTEMEQKKLEGEEATANSIVEALELQYGILKESLAQADAAVKEGSSRVTKLRDAQKRGYVTALSMDLAQNYMFQALTHWHDVRGSIVRVEESLSKAAKEKNQVAMAAKVEHEKQLAAAVEAVKEEQIKQIILAQFLLGTPASSWESSEAGIRYKILRRTPSGSQELWANEMTGLFPGDVLQILRKPHETFSARPGAPIQTSGTMGE